MIAEESVVILFDLRRVGRARQLESLFETPARVKNATILPEAAAPASSKTPSSQPDLPSTAIGLPRDLALAAVSSARRTPSLTACCGIPSSLKPTTSLPRCASSVPAA